MPDPDGTRGAGADLVLGRREPDGPEPQRLRRRQQHRGHDPQDQRGLNGFEDRLGLYTRAVLVLRGYKLEKGIVLGYQRDAGFTGRDLDDIPGPRTRAARDDDLRVTDPLTFGEATPPSAVSPPANWLSEISEVRAALAGAARRLAAMQSG